MRKRLGRHFSCDLVVDEPSGALIEERIKLFSGLLLSSEPVPEFEFDLNGIRHDEVTRFDSYVPAAPPDNRYVTRWFACCETTPGWLDFAVLIAGGIVARRRFHCRPRDRAWTGRPLVYVMHIPKTGGTTVRYALERHIPALRLLQVYDNSIFLGTGRYLSFSPAASNDLDVVIGHFGYGLHVNTTRASRYVTVLRRPAAFAKSFYLHKKYTVQRDFSEYRSIEEAIESSGYDEFDNFFTRLIAGRFGGGPVTDADFDAAVRHLEADFEFVGDAEDMGEAILGVGNVFGLSLSFTDENVTPPTPETDAIDLDELESRFAARWRYDERLRAIARRRFDPARVKCLAPLLPAPDPDASRLDWSQKLKVRIGRRPF